MWWMFVVLSVLAGAGRAGADDAPIVRVEDGRLNPSSLSVHVGEVVHWQAPPDRSLRIELDPHPGAHEAAERAGNVRAMFLKSGEHSYVVKVLPDGRQLRGTVIVREPRGAWERALDCADGSSSRICFLPY
jgi:plastocyanin